MRNSCEGLRKLPFFFSGWICPMLQFDVLAKTVECDTRLSTECTRLSH